MLKSPLVLWICFLKAASVFSCTAFLWQSPENSFLGKSYDWHHQNGYLMTNQKGVRKTGFTIRPWEYGPEWVSKYGSVTFNQYGREFPNGGMNEAGLVVEVLWLNESEYEGFDRRPVLNQLTWIQYQLDNFSTVQEVIEALPKYRFSPIQGKTHYFLCDQSRNCAVVEWLKGKPVVHSGETLAPQAITNDSFEKSHGKLMEVGSALEATQDSSSLSRFLRVASVIQEPKGSLGGAFELLDQVMIPNHTTWQITYDMENLTVFYRTQKNRELRSVSLKAMKLDCSVPNKMLDIHEGSRSMEDRFTDFNPIKNYELLQDSLSDISGAWALIPFLQRYPALTECVND